jgi:hypothetical protein
MEGFDLFDELLVPQLNTDMDLNLDLHEWELPFSPQQPIVEGPELPIQEEEQLQKPAAELAEEEIDEKLYRLFPMEALRKPRNEFGKWKKACKNAAVRSLTPRETKRLSALRRMILARVYAEKARQKKGEEADSMKCRLGKLQEENENLRQRVQTLEGILADLKKQFSRGHQYYTLQ